MLEAIRERDRKLHYCATCGNRVYDLDDEDNPHNYTVEQCNAYLAEKAAKRGEVRQPDQKTGHLCWSPEDHHPFVEGEIPDHEEAERDRRTLLKMMDDRATPYGLVPSLDRLGYRTEGSRVGERVGNWTIVSDHPYQGFDRPGERFWCRAIGLQSDGESITIYGSDKGLLKNLQRQLTRRLAYVDDSESG